MQALEAEDNQQWFQEIETQRPGLSADLSEPTIEREKGAGANRPWQGGMSLPSGSAKFLEQDTGERHS